MKVAVFLAAVAAPLSLLSAQNICEGNGVGTAYIDSTPAVIGRTLEFNLGSPGLAGGFGVLSLSGSSGPFNFPHPLIGSICLDPTHPFYFALLYVLDGSGNANVTIPIPAGMSQAAMPPFYADALTVESGPVFSISKTVRVEWANPDGHKAVPVAMAAQRQMHTATALGADPRDNVTGVLVAGGATGSIIIPTPTASMEVWDPLTRGYTPAPSMSVPRSNHRAVRLPDGRVLITGGVTTGGAVTATCEIYDPATNTLAATGSMNAPRTGHGLTLLQDGRVLASGGLADYRNAATNFIGVLNTAQDTAETYDPVAGQWTALAQTMASKRSGHSQTLLPDGRVLLVSGINAGSAGPFGGGAFPTYTPSCEVFDPTTNAFSTTASIGGLFIANPARAFHGASVLQNGDVLITGGFFAGGLNGESQTTAACAVWNGSTWTVVPALQTPVAFHTQVEHNGAAIVAGGFTGDLTTLQVSPQVGTHDGVAYTPGSAIGIEPGLGGAASPTAAHTMTRLHDGTFLILGGAVWPATLDTGFVYTPN